MAKLLKLRRGTTSQHSSFTGAEGEVTVDTTKDTAVVHDGSTTGGRPLLREDLDNMPASGVSAGTYGSSSAIPSLTVDAKGRVTGATTTAIDSTAITNGTSSVSVANNGSISFVRAGTTQAVVTDAGIKFGDGRKALYGDANDLQIFHDGTNSRIENNFNDLILENTVNNRHVFLKSDDGSGGSAVYVKCDGSDGAVKLYNYGSQKLNTKSDGVDITGELQCDSLDVDGVVNIDASKVTYDSSNGLKLADSTVLRFGSGNDLNIYHDGNHSFIDEAGVGNLLIRANATTHIQKYTGEMCASFHADSGVDLYYDNAKKFETVSNGAKVIGRLEVTGDLNLAGELNLVSSSDHGRIMDVRLGSSDFLIRGTSGGDVNHEKLVKFTRNGGCELYHNDNKKFEITSSGATVTGTLTATNLAGDGVVPAGAILMWSGAQNAIPSGYVICDGNNGTPNLFNRFIVGAGSSYAVDATGGSANTTLGTSNLPGHSHSTPNHSHAVNSHTHSTPNHSHGVNAHSHSTPNHNHNMNNHSHSTNNTGGHSHGITCGRPSSSTDPVRIHRGDSNNTAGQNTNSAGNHSHNTNASKSNTNASGGGNTGNSGANTTNSGGSNTGGSAPNTTSSGASNTGNTGSGSAFENRPPYYALCYIMKT